MTKKRIAKWTLIEQVGIFNSYSVQSAYGYAYASASTPNVFTFKKLLQLSNPNISTVSAKQKKFLRGTKNPSEVIILANEYDLFSGNNAEFLEYLVEYWLDRADVRIVVVDSNYIAKEINVVRMYPEMFQEMYTTDSRARRCASIWANALGWQFSSPLYRDDYSINTMECGNKAWRNINSKQNANKGEMHYSVKDSNGIDVLTDTKVIYKDTALVNALEEQKKTLTKYTSSPETYRKNHCVASDYECQEFFNFYKELYLNGLLEIALEHDYKLCPHCGKPIYISQSTEEKQCQYCSTIVQR